MKLKFLIGLSSALCLCTTTALAQSETNEVEQLKQQLLQMQENFERTTPANRGADEKTR